MGFVCLFVFFSGLRWPGLAARRRERAAQDARLSLRSLGNRGLGTDHTHTHTHTEYPRQPRLWSYSPAISMQLEMCSRDYCPGE